jgi:hypothetical protein
MGTVCIGSRQHFRKRAAIISYRSRVFSIFLCDCHHTLKLIRIEPSISIVADTHKRDSDTKAHISKPNQCFYVCIRSYFVLVYFLGCETADPSDDCYDTDRSPQLTCFERPVLEVLWKGSKYSSTSMIEQIYYMETNSANGLHTTAVILASRSKPLLPRTNQTTTVRRRQKIERTREDKETNKQTNN